MMNYTILKNVLNEKKSTFGNTSYKLVFYVVVTWYLNSILNVFEKQGGVIKCL